LILQVCWLGKQKEKERTFCAEAPGRHVLLADRPLAGLQSRGAAGGGIPAWGLTGGVGKVGEKRHGVERNPRVGSVGRGTAGGGGSAEQERRRRRLAAAAAVQWPGAAPSRSGSTCGGRGRWLRGRFGAGKGGGVSPTAG